MGIVGTISTLRVNPGMGFSLFILALMAVSWLSDRWEWEDSPRPIEPAPDDRPLWQRMMTGD